jgi:hypothetical protein
LAEAILRVSRALMRSLANEESREELQPVQLLAVFPLVQRAVFFNAR